MPVEKITITDEEFKRFDAILRIEDGTEEDLTEAQMVATFQRYLDTDSLPEGPEFRLIKLLMLREGDIERKTEADGLEN